MNNNTEKESGNNSANVPMWFPKLKKHPDKRLAMGVPLNGYIKSGDDYWDRLVIHLQGLIEGIQEKDAKELIELNIKNGATVTGSPYSEWGELLVTKDEIDQLIDDALSEIDEGISLDVAEQIELQKKAENFGLKDVLVILREEYKFTDEDRYLINVAEDLVGNILSNKNLGEEYVDKLNRFYEVLENYPYITNGVCYMELSLGMHLNGETNYISVTSPSPLGQPT